MYCVGRIRSPHPWVLGRPIPCIGSSASPVAIKPPMANPLDELCWSYQDPTFSPSIISPPSAGQLSGKLLLKCLQDSLEKKRLREQLSRLASEHGVRADGDVEDLLTNIGSPVAESERRMKNIEGKYLDQAMKIQVLEMELAQARQQRDIALKELQDLTWQPGVVSPPAASPNPSVSWCSEGNPQTPSTAPTGNQSKPDTAPYNPSTPATAPYNPSTPDTAPYNPSTPDTAPYNPSTPDTAPYNPSTPGTAPYNPSTPNTVPIDTIQLPLIPSDHSPPASGSGAVVGMPPTVPLSAQAHVVHHSPSTSRSPSVGAAIGGTTSPSIGAAAPTQTPSASSFVWGMADLTSFHQGGDDIVLGSGVHGTVSLHRHRVTNLPIALKSFILPNDIQKMTRKVEAIEVEAFILDVLGREECFPTFLGCLEISPGKIGMAMEFIGDASNGETWTLSRGMQELALSQHDWYSLALDIAKSLGLIHEKGFLMNDLKEDNCLLRKTSSGRWQAVIVDFGLACSRTSPYSYCFSREDKEKYRRREVYVHIAPECAFDGLVTSVSSDVFQLGRLLTLMGDATTNADLTAIGNVCRQNSHLCRPSINEVVDELERVM